MTLIFWEKNSYLLKCERIYIEWGWMMKRYLKHKMFSWSIRYSVKDENDNARLIAKQDLSTNELYIYNLDDIEVAHIRRKMPSLRQCYLVEIDDRVVCEIAKEFRFFRPVYRLKGLPWRLEGDFQARKYSLIDGEKQIMQLSKKWSLWGGTYQLDIMDPCNELLCLCIALAVEHALVEYNDRRSGTG